MIKIKNILILIIILSFASCEKDIFNVSDEFNVYVKRFEREASLRDVNINIADEGLKVEFTNFSKKNRVGLCHYETPIRIEIDKSWWNNASDSKKEYIMFHELGHGFLNIRGHRNKVLPNDHWKSMMRGSPENVGKHKFLYEEHRDYYLDELFNKNTPIPDWAKTNQ